jgi:DNA uptake protein ComE-like DNA-binding protein
VVFALLVPFALAQKRAKQSYAAGQQNSTSTKSSAQVSSKIDINSATKEWQTFPGVGDATAQKIIDHRPYQARDELVTKKIVAKTTYDKIKEQLSFARKSLRRVLAGPSRFDCLYCRGQRSGLVVC